jgi:hypothetical protein
VHWARRRTRTGRRQDSAFKREPEGMGLASVGSRGDFQFKPAPVSLSMSLSRLAWNLPTGLVQGPRERGDLSPDEYCRGDPLGFRRKRGEEPRGRIASALSDAFDGRVGLFFSCDDHVCGGDGVLIGGIDGEFQVSGNFVTGGKGSLRD